VTDIRIDPEFQALIPPMRPEERAQLEANLVADGVREPLVVWYAPPGDHKCYGDSAADCDLSPGDCGTVWHCRSCDHHPAERVGVLLDGHNRYEIATRLGLPFDVIERELETRDEAVLWIVNNQFGRRNLLDAARIQLGMRIEPILAEQAKARQAEGQQRGGEIGGRGRVSDSFVPTLEQSYRDVNATKTATLAAEAAGMKRSNYHKGKTVLLTAPAAIVEAYRAGELSTNQAYQQVRREQKEAVREARRDENRAKVATVAAPTVLARGTQFATIVIDPPWDWSDEGDQDQFGRARPDYGTMTIEQLERLPVATLADDDCHLYLWITNRSLPKGFRLLEAWGFRYVTALTWVKPSFGMGNYFRGQTEHVLFAVRGSQPLKRRDASTVLHAPRGPNGHSSKPAEFAALVESCSPGPYLEMFSRTARPDWTAWGEDAAA
jgi:N6-adenosine-specific RNA methylase IME4